ncbi:MAG: thiamine phosphate synthase [Planctomycetota bacterium]
MPAPGGLSTPVPARERLAAARLCVLVSGGVDVGSFERLVGGLVAAGVPMVQLRDKQLPDEVLVDRCRLALAVARRLAPAAPPLVIVNDRVEVAVAAAADGVHVGAGDMPVIEARQRLGPTALIGRTAHSLPEAEAAVAAGADYLGVGPCFPSATKAFSRHAPQEFLAGAAGLPVPVFAIGGIDAGRIGALAGLGLTRVAVAAGVTAAAEPVEAARAILAALRH